MALAQGFVQIDKSKHDLKSFKCGKQVMDEFLVRHAIQHRKLGISSTWILSENTQSQIESVAAYFTLCSISASNEELPLKKSHPKYPLPLVLLARLAVSENYQKKRLGEKTLVSAIRQAVSLTSVGLPAIGIALDVLDQDALAFYNKFDMFEEFTDNPMRLFVPMNVAKDI